MRETIADAALVAAASAGAVWLRQNKSLEPDWTWVEVTVGVIGVWLHAEAHGRARGGTWRDQQRRLLRGFCLAGGPIIAGEVEQWLVRRRQFRDALARGGHDDPAAALARWGRE